MGPAKVQGPQVHVPAGLKYMETVNCPAATVVGPVVRGAGGIVMQVPLGSRLRLVMHRLSSPLGCGGGLTVAVT
jgi:hypothetical protein